MTSSPSKTLVANVAFNKVVLIGVGLIGASLGLALKNKKKAQSLVGCGRSQSNLDAALHIGAIDSIGSFEKDICDADLIIISVPVSKTQKILEGVLPHLQPSTLIMDVGSTKSDVIAAAKLALGEKVGQFIPAHPIAGGAKHGAFAAQEDLFLDRQVVLCPIQENTKVATDRIEALWAQLGSNIYKMSAVQHDAIFATVSHLPHLLSYALMLQVTNAEDASLKFRHAGAGFRDFTRIAGSSPEMWRDISIANRASILKELDSYQQILDRMRTALQESDGELLEKMFTQASLSRNNWEG